MQEPTGTVRNASGLSRSCRILQEPLGFLETHQSCFDLLDQEHKRTIQSPEGYLFICVLKPVRSSKNLLELLGVHPKFQKPVRTVTCPLEPLGIHQLLGTCYNLQTSTKPLDK